MFEKPTDDNARTRAELLIETTGINGSHLTPVMRETLIRAITLDFDAAFELAKALKDHS